MLPYPIADDFTRVIGYARGDVIFEVSPLGYANMSEDEKADAVSITRIVDEDAFEAALQIYEAERDFEICEDHDYDTDIFDEFAQVYRE